MKGTTTEKALRACCVTYEKASIEQQNIISSKDKEIRKLSLRVGKLETIITNNIKNGKSFL